MIKDKETWWKAVDGNWNYLKEILWKFLPMAGFRIISGIGRVEPSAERMELHVEELKQNHDSLLKCYFDIAWEVAPDSSGIHRIAGWGILCELCSEGWVLDKGDE